MNFESWDPLYTLLLFPLISAFAGLGLKLYADYTERKERAVSIKP